MSHLQKDVTIKMTFENFEGRKDKENKCERARLKKYYKSLYASMKKINLIIFLKDALLLHIQRGASSYII